MKSLPIPALMACTLVFSSCTKSKAPTDKAEKAEAPAKKPEATKSSKLVVYSGRSEALVGGILKSFDEANADLSLDIRYNKTPALAAQVKAEGEACPADVLWFQDSGYLASLQSELKTLPAKTLERVHPRFHDAEGKWVGVTGRLRVLVYNTDALEKEDLPTSLKGLTDGKWKGKLGWAPTNASFQAHVSALRKIWGQDETKAWLKGVVANAPKGYPKNSPQVMAANNGEIQVGWVNHYYLHKLKKEGFKAANWSFTEAADAGNVLMLSGIGVRSAAKNTDGAERLVAYLLSDEVQMRFAGEAYEYPTVPNIDTHDDVPALDHDTLAVVDQSALADVVGTQALLREVGLE